MCKQHKSLGCDVIYSCQRVSQCGDESRFLKQINWNGVFLAWQTQFIKLTAQKKKNSQKSHQEGTSIETAQCQIFIWGIIDRLCN